MTSRPIIFFDIESTGVDVAKDRIVHLHAKKFESLGAFTFESLDLLLNPGIPIPEEATAVHGISNEQVAGCKTFQEVAFAVFTFFDDCDLAGFNICNFDIPILWEEFHRANITWDTEGIRVIDAGNIFKKKEERTLVAALRFYCGKSHDSAHSASADVDATVDVLNAQLERYSDLAAMESMHGDWMQRLHEFCQFEKRVDLAGKIILNDQGEPVYNVGKAKGVRVVDDPGFGYWMLGKDFSENTKQAVRRILQAKEQPELITYSR